MLTKIDLEKIGLLIDFKLEKSLKKALRGVTRKKDLQLMENRLTRRINLVADYCDSNIIDLEKRTDRIEKHLNLSPLN